MRRREEEDEDEEEDGEEEEENRNRKKWQKKYKPLVPLLDGHIPLITDRGHSS